MIPSSVLRRPRVDIVIASAAEGMFEKVTMLMDRAVQKVKALEEADNFVRRHYLQTKAALIESGYFEQDADRRAGVRIFDEPPGTFNLVTSAIAAASGMWDSDKRMANDYIRKAYVAWNGSLVGLAWCDNTEEQHEIYFEPFTRDGIASGSPRRLTHNDTQALIRALRPAGDGFALAWNEFTPGRAGGHDANSRSEVVSALVH